MCVCKLLVLKEMVEANGFEPSTSWSRTSGQNHISRCPGVTYWFSGRSQMDKSGQVIAKCWRNFWGINSKLLDLLTILAVNSREDQKSKCPIWCRLQEFRSHFSFSSCTQSCTQTSPPIFRLRTPSEREGGVRRRKHRPHREVIG